MLNKHSKHDARVRGWLGGCAVSVLALTTAATLGASTAAAQEEEAGGGIEKMIVTAQFREQALQDTPLAITAISGDALQEQNITNVRDIAQFSPNVTLGQPAASFGNVTTAGIRGIFYGDYVYASEPVVGFYIDDVYYATVPGSVFDLLDLERVEVNRGPQAVLFGKNTIGGAIKLTSKRAQGDGSGFIEATYGRYERLDFRGAVDLPIIPDHLFMRVSAVSKQREGYQRQIDFACAFRGTGLAGTLPILAAAPSCDLGTFGGENVRAGRIALRAIISPDIEANIYADVVRDRSRNAANTLIGVDDGTGSGLLHAFQENVPGGVLIPKPPSYTGGFFPIGQAGASYDGRFIPGDRDVSYANFVSAKGTTLDPRSLNDAWGVSGTLDWSILDNLRFKSISGYRTYDWQNSIDDDISPIGAGENSTFVKSEQFSQEGRFTGELFNDRLEWAIGGFYLRWAAHQKGPVLIEYGDAAPPLLAFVQNDKAVGKSYAGYAHADFAVTDKFHVFGGYRYSHETKSYRFDHFANAPGYSGCQVAPVVPGSCNYFAVPDPSFFKFNISDWRFGANYHVTDDVMVYGQVSTGYRASGVQSRPFTVFQFVTGNFGPERAKAYEVGLKTSWFERRLIANMAAFYTNYSDRQTPLAGLGEILPGPVFSPATKTINAGTAVIEGIEIEIQAEPIPNLLISANWGYIETEQTPAPGAVPGFIDPAAPAPFVGTSTSIYAGAPFGGPKNNIGMRASYRVELGDNVGALTPAINYRYRSVSQSGTTIAGQLVDIEAASIADGYLTWESPEGDWTVLLQVTNFLDHRYFDSKFALGSFPGSYPFEGHPNRPREWAVTVRKSF